MKIINIQIFLFSLLLILSCSGPKALEKIEYEGFSNINRGDSALIKWNYTGVESANFDGEKHVYSGKDSIWVRPDSTIKYDIKLYGENGDTLSLSWRVYVKQEENGKQIAFVPKFPASYTNSKYFKGVLDQGKITSPKHIRFVRAVYLENNTVKMRALVLDEFGNYLSGLSQNNLLEWSISHDCSQNPINEKINNYSEKILGSENISLGIMIDNSSAADFNSQILGSVKEFSKKLHPEDNFFLAGFNHNNYDISTFSKVKNINSNAFKLPPSGGLNAMYKAAYQNILAINPKEADQEKALIIITFSSNNAATIYNIQDPIKLAKKNNVPVYVVAIGNAIDSYSLKYLTGSAGGRYYNIDIENIHLLGDILSEIRFSMLAGYEFDLPESVFGSLACTHEQIKIDADFAGDSFSDNYYAIQNPKWMGSKHQSIAAFDYKAEKLNPDYDKLIESLGRVLKDNTEYAVELVGHSSIEGDEKANMKFSSSRANLVRDKLLAFGVSPSQIQTRAMGSGMPLFYMPHSPWQQYYNRRVEVRWLIPDMLPFEILASEFWTEEEAIKDVNNWRKRGQKAYYERYLVNNSPLYRTKLWGYKTRSGAESQVSILSKKYKLKMSVE